MSRSRIAAKCIEARLELGHGFGRGALLRREHRTRAFGTAQRARDVACDVELRLGEPRVETGEIDAGQPRQRRTARADAPPGVVEQRRAERLQQARAGVVRRAPTETDDDARRTGIERSAQHLADAARGRETRIALRQRQQAEAAGLGRLHHRRAIGQGADAGVHRNLSRARHLDRPQRAARGEDERFQRALAAIGDGPQHEFEIGSRGARAALHRQRGLPRRHRLLEGGRREDELHGAGEAAGVGG